MIKKYNEFLNEGIFDLLSGYSIDEVKEKLNRLTPLERFNQLNKLKLTYQDVYTKEEIDNFIGLDKIYASNKYDCIGYFFGNIAFVVKNEKYGIIDLNGNELIPLKYDQIEIINDKIISVVLNTKHGIVDINTDKEIIPIKYDWISNFLDNRAKIKLNNKYGIIGIEGNDIIPIKFNYIGFSNYLFDVKLNNKYGLFDIDGNKITDIKYDYIDIFNDISKVKLNDKWGIIDNNNGNEITPIKYDFIENFYNGRAFIKIDDKTGYIDKKGKEYWN